MKKKKPDYIVFDEKSKKYDASIRKFPTNLSAPNFSTLEVNKTIPFRNCKIFIQIFFYSFCMITITVKKDVHL